MKSMRTTIAAAAISAMSALPAAAGADTVKIGWTTWDDAEAVTKMAAIILRQGMGQDAELTLSDIAIQYRSLAMGELDAMLMAWLPGTHADYMERYGDRLVVLGSLYENARIGLAVNAHCDEALFREVGDLADSAAVEAMGGSIHGIDPNSGTMRMAREMVERVNGAITLKEGTSFSMTRDVLRATEDGECAVFTIWNPHPIFAQGDFRYLDDPDAFFGEPESVHVIARQGFAEDFPEAAGFLSRMHFEMPELEALLAHAQRTGSIEASVREWIASNRETVTFWMTGE